MKTAILVNEILNVLEGPACGEVFGRLNGSLDLRLDRRIALVFELEQVSHPPRASVGKSHLGPEG